LGRINRNTVISDWSAPKPFPGVFNPTIAYNYEIFSVNIGFTPYIQVNFDDPAATELVSAYSLVYNPASLGTNYLGDPGSSSNFFPGDPLFFQVVAPLSSNLVIVVNNTTPGIFNVPFHLIVEGFTNTQFGEIPEPGTLLLTAAVLILFAGRRRRRYALAMLAAVITLGGAAYAQDISPQARQQIVDILNAKRQLTPAQQKMDSRLAFASAVAANTVSAVGLPLDSSIAAGPVVVDIQASCERCAGR